MPTRISAGACIDDHPCFFTFYSCDPIDCKITNFSLCLFVCFFITSAHHFKRKNDYQKIFFAHLISMYCIHWFSTQNSRRLACSQCITTLHFQLLRTLLVTFQANNSIRRAPASSALTKSNTEAITCLPQIITCIVVKKGMEHKVSFGRAMMQALECCSWQKGKSQD